MNHKITHFDVIIVGAGLSGISAAYHLANDCPNLSFTIIEARAEIGGTWDLFKYPGIRSDSDMYTFGFSFNPWKNPKAIADGSDILKYINETADDFGIRERIQFHKKVKASKWSSQENQWSIEVENVPENKQEILNCKFLFMCSGYYNYDQGYAPAFPDQAVFQGTIIHPQNWDTELDYTDKNMVIIGSGATAITLLPELAKKAKRVTMLQRSPTYIANLPSKDVIAGFLNKVLPNKFAYQMARWKNILFGMLFYQACRKWPKKMAAFFKKNIKKELGDLYEEVHFSPKYKPWDQRFCVVPDNDFFKALKNGNAEIVTDHIQAFTTDGIALKSGETIPADIIVTATGLQLQLFGGMKLMIDDVLIDTSKLHAYKGVMLSEVPNFAIAVGYTNASWTLKCDLNCHFVTKVLNHMNENNYAVCQPKFDHQKLQSEPLLDFDAGYVLRAKSQLPSQGSKAPWKVYQNYVKDLFSLKYGDVKDQYLEYS